MSNISSSLYSCEDVEEWYSSSALLASVAWSFDFYMSQLWLHNQFVGYATYKQPLLKQNKIMNEILGER